MPVHVAGTWMTAFSQTEKRDTGCHDNNKEEVMKLRGNDEGWGKDRRIWREKEKSRNFANTGLVYQILTK